MSAVQMWALSGVVLPASLYLQQGLPMLCLQDGCQLLPTPSA